MIAVAGGAAAAAAAAARQALMRKEAQLELISTACWVRASERGGGAGGHGLWHRGRDRVRRTMHGLGGT